MALNPARRGTRALLSSPQSMHAAVLSSFPPDAPEPADGAGRILWRVDRPARDSVQLFVTSPTPPDLTHVTEQAGWPTNGTWQTRDYSPLLQRLVAGQTWRFRLTANPVRHTRTKDGEETKPHGHVTVGHQTDWLLARAAVHGFALPHGAGGEPNLVVHDRRVVRFKRVGGEVTIVMATYDGVLEVIDAQAMRSALTLGIGRAKGYGCGLLTLAPAA